MKHFIEKISAHLTFQGFRRACFIVFALLYLVLCPLILLYAFGYIFQPEKQKIVRTGLAAVSTFPSGADLYLGSSRFTKKTPAVITDLLPGRYSLKIFLKNYRPWMRHVDIHPGLAASFDRIILIPRTLPLQILSRQIFKELIPTENQKSFFLSKGPGLKDLFLFDPPDQSLRSVLIPAIYQDARLINFFPLKTSGMVVQGSWKGNDKYFLIRPSQAAVDISAAVLEPPEAFYDVPDNPDILFSVSRGALTAIKIQTGQFFPDFAGPLKGFGLHHKKLYFLDKNRQLISNTFHLDNPQFHLDESALPEKLLETKDFYDITVLPPRFMVFLGKKGELFINSWPYLACPRGCLGFSFNPRQQKILFWTKHSITVLTLAGVKRMDKDSIDSFFFPDEIFRDGKDIQQCFWAYDFSHILFKDEEKICLLELPVEGNPRLEVLTEAKKDSPMYYSENSGTMIFIDPQNGALKSLQLWPGSSSLLPLSHESEQDNPAKP